jgi:hypothetical protein
MRLLFRLPRVQPAALTPPTTCPTPGCAGTHFRLHQQVVKRIRDTVYQRVPAYRYYCYACRHTFRVYPPGVRSAQTSQRVQGLAVMLYLLGLSYGATALALEALGCYLCKSRVYDAVQAATAAVPGLQQRAIFAGLRTPGLGADLTSVTCKGHWLPLGLTVDPLTGLVLTMDQLPAEDAAALQEWLTPLATAVGAEVLVTDDADGFKQVAAGAGLRHQVIPLANSFSAG